jgi:hypothetical protein
MTALVVALALGALAGGMISVAVGLEDYEARRERTPTLAEWRHDRVGEGAATVLAAVLTAADAAADVFELARRAAIWLAPRRASR